jgi:hypothetical protein
VGFTLLAVATPPEPAAMLTRRLLTSLVLPALREFEGALPMGDYSS